jgi:hypothetical protein
VQEGGGTKGEKTKHRILKEDTVEEKRGYGEFE